MSGSLSCILLSCLSVVAYFLVAFRWLLADYRRPVPYLFCLPFPNRASDSGDLYIDFNRNQLPFPVALLDFQVESRFNHSFPNHAYASHTASRISCHVHVLVVYYVVCFFLVLLLRVGSDNIAFVRNRSSSSWTRSSSSGISGKMTIPSKSLLSLLAVKC